MGHRYLVAVALIASCSPPAHPKKRHPRPERVAREPDDVRAGAVPIPLVDGAASYRGQLDGPGSDTVDWLYIDRPAPAGDFTIDVRGPKDVYLRAFDGGEEIRTIPRWDGKGPPSITIPSAPVRVFIELSDSEKDAGPYDLAIAFVIPPPPAPVDAAVDAPPPDALRWCKVGEVADDCHRAPLCNWTKVDPTNPRCAPEQRPPDPPRR